MYYFAAQQQCSSSALPKDSDSWADRQPYLKPSNNQSRDISSKFIWPAQGSGGRAILDLSKCSASKLMLQQHLLPHSLLAISTQPPSMPQTTTVPAFCLTAATAATLSRKSMPFIQQTLDSISTTFQDQYVTLLGRFKCRPCHSYPGPDRRPSKLMSSPSFPRTSCNRARRECKTHVGEILTKLWACASVLHRKGELKWKQEATIRGTELLRSGRAGG